jgi:S-DNA-T family DNA segregation ATPase FtsK/SpoIIIE
MKPIRIVLSPTRSRPANVFLGLALLLVSLLFLLSLATYHPTDPSWNTSTDTIGPRAAANWVGIVGAFFSDIVLQALGLTAFILPLWLAGIGWTWMHSRPSGSALLRWVGTLLTLAFLPASFGLLPWHWRWLNMIPVEGLLGSLVAARLVMYLNIQGAWLVAGALAATGLYFASAVSFWALKESIEYRWQQVTSLLDRWRNWREQRAEARLERLELAGLKARHDRRDQPEQTEARHGFIGSLFHRRGSSEADELDSIPAYQRRSFHLDADDSGAQVPVAAQPAASSRKPSIWERSIADLAVDAAAQPPVASTQPAPASATQIPVAPVASAPVPVRTTQVEPVAPASRPFADSFQAQPPQPKVAPAPRPAPVYAEPAPRPEETIAIHNRADADLKTTTVAPKNVSGFKLPPSTLLNTGSGPQNIREDALREEAKVLVEKCGEFDVRGQVVQINPGPMVTTYEFKPEAGVKYSRVTGLADDLCLAMRAESILIERMAGKSTVGIQVPNHERETIHLRDIIESETFTKAKSRLTLAMGKDINGRIVVADLATMPHVLIAGSTGSGKSVAINAMIMSLLYRTTPSQVRLILVDPKRVELGMYEGVPHLFTPIITEPKLAANALRNAVREMERRLKLLASRSVRNIDQYNKLFESGMPSLFDDGEDDEPLPYIVIIIDELADLMMLDRANVEESITRLAQMARAVGIHLVLATQRPSVDVITGLIKANVPTRISFRLATKVDSRTILDTNGAESLLGRGDMLFLPPGTSRLVRLHAPYVSEKETAAVVGFWKAQGQAEYVEGFLESPKDDRPGVEGGGGEEDNDPLFDDAVRLVFEFGKASTSLIQRRLRVGYGRAAHLIDLMERDGLVGPADGSRPRELLKPPGWLHEVPTAIE